MDRILFLAPRWHGFGGVEAVARIALEGLSALPAPDKGKHEAWSLEAWPDRSPVTLDHWNVLNAESKRLRIARWGMQAAVTSARKTHVVVMHLHLGPVALPLVTAGAKLSIFLHGIEAWEPLRGLRLRALQAAHLIANSKHTVERFKQCNPKLADKDVTLCLLGSDETPPRSAPYASFIDKPFALITGRLSAQERYKGHDLLLDLWPAVLKDAPDARLLIAGEGDDRARLEAKTRELKLEKHVHFAGGIPDDVLAGLFERCAFFVMPSTREGFGLVYLEAMRANKACIAAKGAPEEIIIEGKTGFIVDVTKPETLRVALSKLFSDPAQCRSMGEAGRARFLDQFTAEHFKRRFRQSLGLEGAAD